MEDTSERTLLAEFQHACAIEDGPDSLHSYLLEWYGGPTMYSVEGNKVFLNRKVGTSEYDKVLVNRAAAYHSGFIAAKLSEERRQKEVEKAKTKEQEANPLVMSGALTFFEVSKRELAEVCLARVRERFNGEFGLVKSANSKNHPMIVLGLVGDLNQYSQEFCAKVSHYIEGFVIGWKQKERTENANVQNLQTGLTLDKTSHKSGGAKEGPDVEAEVSDFRDQLFSLISLAKSEGCCETQGAKGYYSHLIDHAGAFLVDWLKRRISVD